MKKIKIALFFMFLSGSANTLLAQYNNGYGGNGYGNNGRMSQLNQDTTPSAPKQIPVEVTVAKVMETLKTELTLDALQEIAITNLLVESIKAQGVVIKQESSQENKVQNLKIITENTDRKVMEFLNKDQKEKYLILSKEGVKKSKKKKK